MPDQQVLAAPESEAVADVALIGISWVDLQYDEAVGPPIVPLAAAWPKWARDLADDEG